MASGDNLAILYMFRLRNTPRTSKQASPASTASTRGGVIGSSVALGQIAELHAQIPAHRHLVGGGSTRV